MSWSFFTFCSSLTAVLIISSLVKILAPKEKMNRMMSLVIGVFFLLCMTSPILKLVEEFEFPEEKSIYSSEYEDVSNGYVLRETAEYLSAYLKESLISSGVKCSSVKVTVVNDDEKGIILESVSIYLSEYSTEDSLKTSQLVKSTVGVEPQIVY